MHFSSPISRCGEINRRGGNKKKGYFQFSWPVDGNIKNGVRIRVCQCVTGENDGVCEAEKMMAHNLIAIKLLHIPPERLSLATVHVDLPFHFNKGPKVNSTGVTDCRGWRLRMALHCKKKKME